MKAAALYFAMVFGTGFVLGTIRQLWLLPRMGTRAAELMEMPLMLLAIFWAAGFVVRRYPNSPLRTGLLALVFLLGAEVALGMLLTGRSVVQVLFERDPVSGGAYYASLGVFAVMPAWLRRSS